LASVVLLLVPELLEGIEDVLLGHLRLVKYVVELAFPRFVGLESVVEGFQLL